MQWSNRWTIGPREYLERRRLRRAALRYAGHGWAVAPGACPAGHRLACDRADCRITGCHPAIESWQDDAGTDPPRVARWWRRRPYPVLLITGGRFDVLDVPAAVGLRTLGAVRLHTDVLGAADGDARGPVAVTPSGRWMFLVRPGADLRPELGSCPDVRHHGRGSWIPAAPSRTPEGPVRWAVPPEQTGWQLPESAAVQAMLLDALSALGRRPRPATIFVPRQMSTARRAA